MKNDTTQKRQSWKLIGAALSGILLIPAVGCLTITINMGEFPKAGSPGAPQALNIPRQPDSGTFVPVQGAPLGGGQTTVCGQPVSGTYVRFSITTNGQTLLTQTPPSGYAGFRGTVLDLTAGSTIANTDYYLQWFINSLPQNNGCCTNVAGSGTEVGCKVTAGMPYRFTAFFKTGHVPPGNHDIQLQGAWTH
jgi:hypothetical protein